MLLQKRVARTKFDIYVFAKKTPMGLWDQLKQECLGIFTCNVILVGIIITGYSRSHHIAYLMKVIAETHRAH